MKIYHKKIYEHEVGCISWFLKYYAMIAGEKNCRQYCPVMEIFSERIWKLLPIREEDRKDERFNYKFSPGKMNKNFIKLYFLEMPLDYVILEVVEYKVKKFTLRYAENPVNPDFYTTFKISL